MLVIACFLFVQQIGWTQQIVKVIPKYVLVDTDQGIGEIGDVVGVYSHSNEGLIKVGDVKIMKFLAGQTGAKIVRIEPGLSISIGDIVKKDEVISSSNAYTSADLVSEFEQTESIPRPSSRFGIGIGRFVPAQGLDRFLSSSFCINASYRFTQMNSHSFFIDVSFPILKTKSTTNSQASPSLWFFHIGDRIRVVRRIYYDVGFGLYNSKMPVAAQPSQTSSTSKIGFFLGLSLDVAGVSSSTFIPFVRTHMYQANSEWQLLAIAGVSFHPSSFHF